MANKNIITAPSTTVKPLTYTQALDHAVYTLSGMEGMAETVSKLEALRTQLEKRSRSKASSKKPTKTQVENVTHKENIRNVLSVEEGQACSVIASAVGLSTQKVSALLGQMEGVTRSVIKGVAYYSLTAPTSEETAEE